MPLNTLNTPEGSVLDAAVKEAKLEAAEAAALAAKAAASAASAKEKANTAAHKLIACTASTEAFAETKGKKPNPFLLPALGVTALFAALAASNPGLASKYRGGALVIAALSLVRGHLKLIEDPESPEVVKARTEYQAKVFGWARAKGIKTECLQSTGHSLEPPKAVSDEVPPNTVAGVAAGGLALVVGIAVAGAVAAAPPLSVPLAAAGLVGAIAAKSGERPESAESVAARKLIVQDWKTKEKMYQQCIAEATAAAATYEPPILAQLR